MNIKLAPRFSSTTRACAIKQNCSDAKLLKHCIKSFSNKVGRLDFIQMAVGYNCDDCGINFSQFPDAIRNGSIVFTASALFGGLSFVPPVQPITAFHHHAYFPDSFLPLTRFLQPSSLFFHFFALCLIFPSQNKGTNIFSPNIYA